MAKKAASENTGNEVQTAKNPRPLRSILPINANIVSVKDLADMGTSEDHIVVIVEVNDEYYADTVVVSGAKPKVGEEWRFVAGETYGFPNASKVTA